MAGMAGVAGMAGGAGGACVRHLHDLEPGGAAGPAVPSPGLVEGGEEEGGGGDSSAPLVNSYSRGPAKIGKC